MLEHTLSRISQISKTGTKVQNLAHLLDKEMLTICFKELDPHKASGIDRVTKEEYGKNLNRNLDELIKRMKGGTYSPKPSKRVYIDKPGTNKKRPLGISCMEDKIVERAIAKLLVEVYEPKFLDCSYGFRPGRNCHQAVSTLLNHIHGLTGYVVEADIRSCFDTIDHDWMIKFLEHDIADKNKSVVSGLLGKAFNSHIIESAIDSAKCRISSSSAVLRSIPLKVTSVSNIPALLASMASSTD